MGTHPIFESDFDCLTDREEMFIRAILSRGIRRAPVVQKRTNMATSFVANCVKGAPGSGTFWADAYIVGIWVAWASWGFPLQFVTAPAAGMPVWGGLPNKTDYWLAPATTFDYKGCNHLLICSLPSNSLEF